MSSLMVIIVHIYRLTVRNQKSELAREMNPLYCPHQYVDKTTSRQVDKSTSRQISMGGVYKWRWRCWSTGSLLLTISLGRQVDKSTGRQVDKSILPKYING